MTIDITNLVNTPSGEEFEEKLKAFQKRHPQFFREDLDEAPNEVGDRSKPLDREDETEMPGM